MDYGLIKATCQRLNRPPAGTWSSPVAILRGRLSTHARGGGRRDRPCRRTRRRELGPWAHRRHEQRWDGDPGGAAPRGPPERPGDGGERAQRELDLRSGAGSVMPFHPTSFPARILYFRPPLLTGYNQMVIRQYVDQALRRA